MQPDHDRSTFERGWSQRAVLAFEASRRSAPSPPVILASDGPDDSGHPGDPVAYRRPVARENYEARPGKPERASYHPEIPSTSPLLPASRWFPTLYATAIPTGVGVHSARRNSGKPHFIEIRCQHAASESPWRNIGVQIAMPDRAMPTGRGTIRGRRRPLGVSRRRR